MTWLAIRELWISYRLLALLVAFVGAGALVALLPATLPAMLERLAVGLGVATLLAAALASWSIAADRVGGRAGWLVSRSVPRGRLVTAWFTTIAGVALVGTAAGVALGWLAASAMLPDADTIAFLATAAGVGAGVVAAVALGLVVGVVLPPAAAAPSAMLLSAALGAVAWRAGEARPLLPGAAVPMLADLYDDARGPAAALASAGVSLVAAALLIMLARLLLSRSDL